MSASMPEPRETEWLLDDVSYRIKLLHPFNGEAVACDVNCEIDRYSRTILAYSIAPAGDRELVIETLREYRGADGSCSDDLLDWASHALGCSRKTILRWLKNGAPPPAHTTWPGSYERPLMERWRRLNDHEPEGEQREAA